MRPDWDNRPDNFCFMLILWPEATVKATDVGTFFLCSQTETSHKHGTDQYVQYQTSAMQYGQQKGLHVQSKTKVCHPRLDRWPADQRNTNDYSDLDATHTDPKHWLGIIHYLQYCEKELTPPCISLSAVSS